MFLLAQSWQGKRLLLKVALHFSGVNFMSLNFLAPDTPIWVDFWIFSDQAQLLDPESVASKEPRSGLVA